MRRIQIVKKLFIKLADFERVRSHVLQCYASSARQRNGNTDNLVPVNFPVKAVFPHTQKSIKPLVASLEFWGSVIIPISLQCAGHIKLQESASRTLKN